MAVTVETLEKLERKITLTLPTSVIQNEVNTRLKRLARQVKVDGFRPGKVPMNIVAQRYGYSVHYEVMNDKVGEAFSVAANEAKLRVAGQPRISEKEQTSDTEMAFDAIFEVYPEVVIKDLSQVEVETLQSHVTEEAVDKTVEILRKQKRTFAQRSMDAAAATDDRVTVDFIGKIDGEPFEGGRAEDFQFVVGEGQMLKEFEEAVVGMKVGESKTFPLSFPEDYQGREVAGKTADFMVTLKKLEATHLPEVTNELAKSLGVADATVEALRADIRKNLEREVKYRLLGRNKQAALDALVAQAELDLPNSIVQSELDRMAQGAREELKQRGIKDADKAPIPEEVFRPQAERRVRMGLVVSEVVRMHNLQATPDQIKAHVEELAASYEKPAEVIRWYYSDNRRMAEVEAIVIENNVTNYVLSLVKPKVKEVSFDELMSQA
ncbi:MAG: trigger factor [Betaproteobacteria bacterium]|jgi:trigger factor|nr:trigger factor [Betaproteobacteria bacterium]